MSDEKSGIEIDRDIMLMSQNELVAELSIALMRRVLHVIRNGEQVVVDGEVVNVSPGAQYLNAATRVLGISGPQSGGVRDPMQLALDRLKDDETIEDD